MDDRALQILIALAWLGVATKDQLHRLCSPDVSLKTVERTLGGLESQGPPLIVARRRASRTSEGTRRLPTIYLLHEAAHELLLRRDDYPRRTANGQYPIKAGGPRADHLVDHDLQVVEAAIGLIVAARRRTLSGVFLARELRLSIGAGALIPDAIILLQFGGVPSDSAVPWTKVPCASASLQAFAIESDRATEPQSTIAGKAALYADLLGTESQRRWAERFHCSPPTPFWIANTRQRAETLNQIWLQAWPNGSWMVSDIERLAEGKTTLVSEGRVRRIRIYGDPKREGGAEPSSPSPRPGLASQPTQSASPEQTASPVTPSPRPSLERAMAQAAPAAWSASPVEPVSQPAQAAASGPPTRPAPPGARIEPEAEGQSTLQRQVAHPLRFTAMRRLLEKLRLPPDPALPQPLWLLPAFPDMLARRHHRSPLTNILCCLGLVLWLPLWLGVTMTARILDGLLTMDRLLVVYLGRLRAVIAWLCIIALLVTSSWATGRQRAAEAGLPPVSAANEPLPAASPTAAEPQALACVPALVTVDRVNLRLAPGLSSGRGPRQLYAGERLEICESAVEADGHRWRLVRTADGGGGYVSDRYLDAATPRRLQELIRAGRIEE